jgi:lipoate-protein ligase A
VTGICRWLPFRIASGPTNMALDEALLEQVAERGDLAYLRAYGWSKATLSLGYFQRMAEVEVEPRWQFAPRVRRATGGGAIWHDHELTYALVIPSNHPRARPHTALYQAVHSAIAGILREQGVEAQRRGPGPALDRERSSRRPFLCFTDGDPEDIVTDGFKVVGSAQRRRGGAILQHGSILLQGSNTTPELPGICDLAEVESDPGFWSNLIPPAIAAALELRLDPSEIPDVIRARTQVLEQDVYRDPTWTTRR